MTRLTYLAGYPPTLQAQAEKLLVAGKVESILTERYPQEHRISSNKDLFRYVQEMKAKHMRSAAPLGKVLYDDRLKVVSNALGTHTTRTRQQGAKTRKSRELRVASLFKTTPADFLRMIVVHELAHMKHADHDRDFYRLCVHMEPEYHQIEFDVRLYLTAQEWAESP